MCPSIRQAVHRTAAPGTPPGGFGYRAPGCSAGIAHQSPNTRRDAAATVDERGGAQRSGDTNAAACHAVYREPGGVPTPPNLRPFSRAGSARSRAKTAIGGAQRPLTRAGSAWQAEQVQAGVGIAARDGQRARARHEGTIVGGRRLGERGTSGHCAGCSAAAAVFRRRLLRQRLRTLRVRRSSS